MSNHPAILYVEDDLQSCAIMRLLLIEDMGLPHVTVFEDSTDFPARVEQLQPKPDVVLLDIHVCPHNGFEMLEMLRRSDTFRNTRVVALTASVMNEEVQKLKDAGFDGVIAKPIDLDTFPEALNRIIKGEYLWRIIA